MSNNKNNKRMKLGKLSQFSGIKPEAQEATPSPDERPPAPSPTVKKNKPKSNDPLVTVAFQLPKSQKQWLHQTATQVRENNLEPTPANERVYPIHLVRTAIDLLRQSDIDWSEVRSIDDLRQQLNL